MAGILDHLKELTANSVENLFYTTLRLRHRINFKTLEHEVIYKGQLLRTSEKWRFRLISPVFEEKFEKTTEATFKLETPQGTYFFKSFIQFIDDQLTLVGPFVVYQLTRRKNIRFPIPKDWNQSASFNSYDMRKLKSTGNILDLSVSGLRVLVDQELPIYQKNQELRVQFKIFRRAEIILKAVVKHIKKNAQKKQELGLEFIELSPVIQNRIDGICSDLSHFLAQDLASSLPIRGYK